MHDPRIGRFFAIDPLVDKYPHYSPYSFSGNKVLNAIELEGAEEFFINQFNPGLVFWNIYGRDYDNKKDEGPQLMTLSQDANGRAIAGQLPWDVIRFTNTARLAGSFAAASWPPNSIHTSANGTATPNSIESFNLVVPSGAGNADGTTGAGPFMINLTGFSAAAGVNLTLVDNFGNMLYNGPPGAGIAIGLFNNTTAIRATITNTTANAAPFNVEITIPGTTDNAQTVAAGDSSNKDVNNTSPTNPTTVVTNTSVTVGRPTPASSSTNPINEISQ
jgi:hypothetical protein